MGWQDAPIVDNTPAWMNAPIVEGKLQGVGESVTQPPTAPQTGVSASSRRVSPYSLMQNIAKTTGKDGREESAKMVQSFIDADKLDIPPDAAYKMQETIGVYAGKHGIFRRGQDESSWPEIVASWGKSLMPMLGRSVGGLEMGIGEATSTPIESGFGLGAGRAMTTEAQKTAQAESEKAWRNRIAEQGEALYAGATEKLGEVQPSVGEETLKYYVHGAGLSTTHMLPLLAAGAITGNPYVTLGLMYLDVKGQKYGEFREQGVSPELASKASTAYALAEAIPEALPLGILFKPASKFLPRFAKFIAAEEGQELFTETLQIMIDREVISPDMTWGDAFKRMKDVAIITPLSAGTIAGVTHPFVKDRVADDTERLLKAHGIDDGTARTEVQKYLNAVEKDAGVVDTGEQRAQTVEAAVSMLENMGLDSETARAEVEKIAGQIEEFKAAFEQENIPEDTSVQVSEDVTRQLQEVGYTEEDAAFLGKMYQSFFRTKTEDWEGLDPFELYKKYNLKITRDTVKDEEGISYNQTTGKIVEDTPEFKAWFGDSKVVDEQGKPLVVYHGTNQDIVSFLKERGGQNTGSASSRGGFFFTESAAEAGDYAGMSARTQVSNAIEKEANAERLLKEIDRAYDKNNFDLAERLTLELEDSEQEAISGEERGANILPIYLNLQNPMVFDMSGKDLHDMQAAINEAKEKGYDGLRLDNVWDPVADRDDLAETTQWIAFSPTQIKSVFNRGTFDPTDPNILFQNNGPSPRGKITMGADGVNIALLETADRSTFLHETAHFYLKVMEDLASTEGAPKDVRNDFKAISKWLGKKRGQPFTTPQHEKFARGFEAYLREGKAPAPGLRGAFERFKDWLVEIYKSAKELNVTLTPEVRQVIDRMLATQPEIDEVAAQRAEDIALLDFAMQKGKDVLDLTDAEIAELLPKYKPMRAGKVKGQVRRATGLDTAVKMIREDEALNASWKKAEQSARKAFREGRTEEAQVWKEKLSDVIAQAREKAERKRILDRLAKAGKKLAKSKIDVEYKKAIDEIISGMDFKDMTAKKRKTLERLANYIEKNGKPLGIQPARIRELKRLAQTQPKDFTTEDLRSLDEQVKHLKAMGRLKAKLKEIREARERAVTLDSLSAETVNLDRHPPQTRLRRKAARSKPDIVFDALQHQYINTLHTFRVADMMDGFQNYKGPNTGLVRRMGQGEETYHRIHEKRLTDFVEKRLELLGDVELSEEDASAVMIHGRFQEGADDAVNTLMDKYGYQVPEGAVITSTEDLRQFVPISDELLEYVDLIRETIGSRSDDVAALHEELTNEIFQKIDNYFLPLLYEAESAVEPGALIREDYKDTDPSGGFVGRTKKAAQGFVKARRAGVKKLPRIDIENVVAEALSAQEWYLNMQPILADTASLVSSRQYQDAAGTVASNWWKDQLDITARKGWKSSYRPNAFTNWLSFTRNNLNRAVLLWKVSTVMMQPFAVIDGMAYAQAKFGVRGAAEVGKEFMKAWIVPGYAKKIIAASEALMQRKGGEVAIEEVLKEANKGDRLMNKVARLGASFIVATDIRTAAGIQQAFKNIFTRLESDNPTADAEFLMQVTQGSAQVTYRPHILATGEGARTWFTFQTFFMNRWGIIIHDLVRGGIKAPEFKLKAAHLIGLSILIAGGFGEDEARDLLRRIMGKKSYQNKEGDLIADVLLYVPEQVPYAGGFIEGARRGFGGGEIPIERTVGNLLSVPADIERGKYRRAAEKGIEAGATLFLGVPGTVQAFDLYEAAIADKKGVQKR